MRRAGDFLARNMPTLFGVAVASVVLTLVCGITAFAMIIMPDRSGVRKVIVPDYVGGEYREDDVEQNIFRVIIEYEYDETVPVGIVIKQYPPAGAERKVVKDERLCTLTLTVSRGRNTVMLPDLAGESEDSALKRLTSLGLSGKVEYVTGTSTPEGSVISTEPSAYADVPVGGTVKLRISGEEAVSIVMPALTGLSETAALDRLARLGLEAGKSDYVKSDKPAGTVIAQSIPFGSTVTSKAKVYLTVSIG